VYTYALTRRRPGWPSQAYSALLRAKSKRKNAAALNRPPPWPPACGVRLDGSVMARGTGACGHDAACVPEGFPATTRDCIFLFGLLLAERYVASAEVICHLRRARRSRQRGVGACDVLPPCPVGGL